MNRYTLYRTGLGVYRNGKRIDTGRFRASRTVKKYDTVCHWTGWTVQKHLLFLHVMERKKGWVQEVSQRSDPERPRLTARANDAFFSFNAIGFPSGAAGNSCNVLLLRLLFDYVRLAVSSCV
jgi:hypothetical protein